MPLNRIGVSPSNTLMGSFGKGSLQKIFRNFQRNFRKLSAEFPHPCLTQCNISSANFRKFSAEFPQTFRKNPFANDPISELLILKRALAQTCLRAWYQVRFFGNIFGHSWGLVYGEGGAPGTVPLHNLRVTSHVLHQEVPLGWYRVRLF